MGKRESYLWRVLRTGFCFAVFGIGALILGLLVLPLLLLVVRDEARRRRHVRSVIHRSFWGFFTLMNRIGGFTCEISGRERLGRPGQLIIANHPTLIDIVMIIGLVPAGCVVKQALFHNPYMKRVVRAAGYISNETTEAMVEAAAAALQSGDTLVMFPEGTRTRPGEPLSFHRGAASVALRAASVLTPVYIRCSPVFLPKHMPWYRVPATRPHLSLLVGADLDLAEYRGLPPPRASRMLTRRLLEHYSGVLAEHDRYNGAEKTAVAGAASEAGPAEKDGSHPGGGT